MTEPIASDALAERFGNRIRVRVAGLILDNEADPGAVLLAEHTGLYEDPIWTPPGGGLHFGESLEAGLKREVVEETGLEIACGPLRYVLDFVRPPLHAVSFYFQCRIVGGTLKTGTDPELPSESQFIRNIAYIPFVELDRLRILPEGLASFLPTDARNGFPEGTCYLGPQN